jgi:hypothetical protein
MRPIVIASLMLASASAEQLRVVVYDQARLPKNVTRTALENLRRIFHQAGIEIEFVAGDAAASEASLITYPAPPPKGREQEAACLARRDIALEIVAVTPGAVKSSILGMAQPLARAGLNARVFDDRIQDAARRENRTHAVVLAHVIAHEIGHVLLRTNAHSGGGLMSARWTAFEYSHIARSFMFFTADQSRSMRMTLRGAGCANQAVRSAAGIDRQNDFGPR